MVVVMVKWNKKGCFKKLFVNKVIVDYNYVFGYICDGESCEVCFLGMKVLIDSRKFSFIEWWNGRWVVEWMFVIEGLEFCW